MNPAIGIDLGTTNTVVAAQTDATGATLVEIAQPVDQRNIVDYKDFVKSAVFFESARSALVGALATRTPGAFRSIKSKMGGRWRIPHPFISDQWLDPAYISGHILKAAFNSVAVKFPEWDRTALITVPASFNTDQRTDTLVAAKLAGFREVRLLDEPTAAFYYYFDQNRQALSLEKPFSVLVFDFGGGTLDVSIIQVSQHNQEILIDSIGRSRYNNLGGDDIDLDIAAFFLACWEFKNKKPINDLQDALRKQVVRLFIEKANLFKEEAEERLAEDLELPEFTINETLRGEFGAFQVAVAKRLTRAQYDELVGRFLSAKQEVNVFRPIGQALDVAAKIKPGFSLNHVDLILYTGGATRMRAVKAALECFFAPKRCFSLSDEEACNTVALGAACCRFDELRRGQNVRMTARMLESVLTRSEDGVTYIPLVPNDCGPAEEFVKVEHEFRTVRDTITLRLPIFRGTGSRDPQLSPMRDCIIHLRQLIKRDTSYFVFYRITKDKTIHLKVRFDTPAGEIEEVTSLELDSVSTARQGGSCLATVNCVGVI